MSNDVNDVDEAGWAVEPGDEMAPTMEIVGSVLKFHREAAGITPAEFGAAMGYGEDMIRKMERGTRIPKVQFLYRADEFLNAKGAIKVLKKHVEEARYPKKVVALKNTEARAVELLMYSNHNIQGLLQTPEYARALFEMTQPVLSPDVVEREVAARMARKAIFEREPAPTLSFVQEQVTLERPYGGKMVLRRQLEHLLEVGQLRNVTLQVMPTDLAENAGTQGLIQVLKFPDGTALGRSDGAFNGRPVSSLRELRILELRYGMIRAQALPPRESQAFIKQMLGRL
ncbi:helix-turn-helix transcriptional regulator [Streptomyces sp. NBC_01485]|uniref:helix-turn-helix domain-containing protein n=1 Tax=Streptomyces sp. NBC_01485 TaxID=2903884 RepID=UPI002E354A6A|nr:helix-turn-helix transcriptional regulator [Streptomyces sp. NBC_01485]